MGEVPRQEEPQQIDYSSRYEHLAEGFQPIMACVGTREEYGEELSEIKNIEKVGHNVDLDSDTEDLEAKDFKNGGKYTYVISTIDKEPKFTEGVFMCTSLAAVGREKKSGDELSFLTHQNPRYFLNKKRWIFTKHLQEKIEELEKRCLKGSIDIVIVGGEFNDKRSDEYEQSLKTLSDAVRETLGFEPLVVCGPKDDGHDDVYFNTQERKLYITRPEYSHYNSVFKPGEIEEVEKKWEKKLPEKLEDESEYKEAA